MGSCLPLPLPLLQAFCGIAVHAASIGGAGGVSLVMAPKGSSGTDKAYILLNGGLRRVFVRGRDKATNLYDILPLVKGELLTHFRLQGGEDGTPSALYVLCVPAHRANDAEYAATVGRWLETLRARAPGALVLPLLCALL